MNKKFKCLKIILSILILALMFILVFDVKSFAYIHYCNKHSDFENLIKLQNQENGIYPSKNELVHLDFKDLISTKNKGLYCIEHGTGLDSWGADYYLYNHVEINGRVAESYKVNVNEGTIATSSNGKTSNKQNAKLAYVLYTQYKNSENSGTSVYGANSKEHTEGQAAVWYYINNWMKVNRSSDTYGENYLKGLDIEICDPPEGEEYSEAVELCKEAEAYAEKMKENQIDNINGTDNTAGSALSITTETINNTTYYRVGKYKWEFSGEISNITVSAKDANKNSININDIKIAKIVNGEKEDPKSLNEGIKDLKSNQPFYIYIKIDTFPGYVNVTGTFEFDYIKASIDFYKAEISEEEYNANKPNIARQNLIMTKASKVEKTYSISTERSFYGNIQVYKYAGDTGTQLTLTGNQTVKFIVKKSDDGTFITGGKSGYWTFGNDKNNAYHFEITSKDHPYNITGLPIGKYTIYETDCNIPGYKLSSVFKEAETITIKSSEPGDTGSRKHTAKIVNSLSNGTLIIKKRDMDSKDMILFGSKIRVTGGPNNSSTEYVLNSDQLEITVIPGNYTIEEIGAPYGYSLAMQPQNEKVKSAIVEENGTSEVILYNKRYPDLTITKLDKTTGRGASGAKFEIKYNGTYYLTSDEDGNGVYSTDYREFDMGIYSSKTIKNIYSGNYHVKEVGAPTGFDINLQEPADIEKDIEVGNGNVELKLYNMRYETLKIKKVDKNSDEIMEGVGFKIRQSEKYLKILNGNYAVTEITGKVEINPVYNQNPSNPYHAEWIDNENEATTFYTDNFGEIEIKNLEANKKYTVKETDIKGDMAMYYPITGEEFDIELKTYSSEEEKQADAIAEIIKKIRNDEKVRSDIFNKNLDEGDMKEHIRFLYDRFNGGDGIENKILMEILKLKYQELEEENFIKFIMCIEDYQYEYTKFVNDYYKGIIEEKAKNITVKDKEMLNREFENFMLNLDSSEFNLSEDTMLFYVKYNSDNSDNSDNSERKFKVDKNAVIENNYNNLNLCALQIVIEGFTFEISVEEIEDEANGEKEFKVIVKDVTSDSDLRKIEDNYENLFEGKRYYDFVIYEGMKSAVNELYEYYTTKNPDEISQMTKKSKIEYYVRRARGEFLIVVENEQKWMSLSGKVWEDKISSSKDSSRNKLLDEWEPLVSGINVYLKRNGVVIAERKTDSNGSYFFGGTGKYNENDPNSADYEILVKNAEEYSIEFSYNGLAYQSVEANIFSERGSKATDLPEDRNKVNENFSTILEGSIKGNDGITTGKTGTDVNLTYTTEYEGEGEKSRLIDTTSYTVDSLNGKINPIDKAIVRANTETGYQIKWKPGIYVVQNINLGIWARQQPDITISTDLDNIKFEINGYSHNYDYNGRASYIKEGLVDVADPAYDALMDGFSIKAKNATGGYKNMSYTREIYDSYIAYTKLNSESENKLKVFVTYKLTLKNESSISKIIINSLKNYADKSLIYDSSWIDNGARVNWGSDISNSNEYSLIQSGIINKEIEPGKIVNVYLRYQLSTDAICNLVTLGEDDEYTLKTNTTEIVSYSSYDSNGNKYGGIDRDSAPGNIDYINIKGYEDDTDATPDLIIKRKISKKITGTVFEDYTYPFLNSDRERKGDGIYDEDENTVKDVKVQLLNYDGDNQVNIYKIDDSRKCSSNLSRSLHG